MERADERGTVRRGLTARGRWLLAGGAATGLVALVLDERDLLFAAAIGVLLPVVAVLLTVRRPRLAVRLSTASPVLPVAGEGTADVRVDNVGRLPGRSLELRLPQAPGLLEEQRRAVPPLLPGSVTTLQVPLVGDRRGRYAIGPVLLRSHDPFGLWEDRRTVPGTLEVLVVPEVVELAGLPRSAAGRGSTTASTGTAPTGGAPDVGVRPYRIGDDVRTIHWRASARLADDVVVRTAQVPSPATVALVLDHRPREPRTAGGLDEAGLDVAATLAASVGLHLAAAGIEVTLTDHTGAVLLEPEAVPGTLQARLADLGRTGHQFTPAVPHALDLVIAIVGPLTDDETAALARVRRRGATAMALVLDPRSFVPARLEHAVPTAATTAQALRVAGWRVAVVDVTAARGPGGAAEIALAWQHLTHLGMLREPTGGLDGVTPVRSAVPRTGVGTR